MIITLVCKANEQCVGNPVCCGLDDGGGSVLVPSIL